uniref:Uncharacterized protein n=1 Tax=Oryza sativa subsp. japonica TaxID=39947 RepID=Q10S16_ORYSJ|nr:hypothetical protein LOC_Os03g04540 [Oryza sativa Japonica Group]
MGNDEDFEEGEEKTKASKPLDRCWSPPQRVPPKGEGWGGRDGWAIGKWLRCSSSKLVVGGMRSRRPHQGREKGKRASLPEGDREDEVEEVGNMWVLPHDIQT